MSVVSCPKTHLTLTFPVSGAPVPRPRATVRKPKRAVPGTIDPTAFRAWAQKLYPRDTAKALARDAGVAPETVEKWLGPPWSMPSCVPVCRLIARHGLDFIRAVFVPPPCWADADVQARALEDIAARAAEIAALARGASGGRS
jgi:hypothetical protein